jgi:hypothetical protein
MKWTVRHANRRYSEDGAEVQSEPTTARMVAARGVDEQDVGEGCESARGTLEQRALTKSEPTGGISGECFPHHGGHIVAARSGCERPITSHAIPPGRLLETGEDRAHGVAAERAPRGPDLGR